MMIAYGLTGKHFFSFTPNAAGEDYPILHVELVRTREDNRDTWTPVLRQTIRDAVHFIGMLEVRFKEPHKLVDFSSQLPGPVQTIEIPEGLHTFELLSIELPKGTPDRFVELAVLPGTVYGVAFTGIVRMMADHQRFWKRRDEQSRLMNVLANHLNRLQSLR